MKVDGICPLCLQRKVLIRSHVIPELLWRRLYGSTGKAISARIDLPYDRRVGRGVRESLLCRECDESLGRYEDYFAKLWYGKTSFPERLDSGIVRNVDYTAFKLFHLAVLWRAHESKLPEFGRVQLGIEAEAIREALHSGIAPGADEFPISAQAVVNPLDNRVVHDLLALPVPFRRRRGWVYAPIYAGCLWYIGLMPGVLAGEANVLQEDGNIMIPTVSLRLIPRIAEIMFRNRPRPRKN